MNKIKQLNEQRAKLLKDAAALDTTKAEDRSKVSAIHAEIEGVDSAIMLEARQLELASKQAPKLSEQEQRDLGRFDTAKLLRHLVRTHKGSNVQPLDGIEAEMIAEGEREARAAGIDVSGVMLPRSLVRRSGFEQRDMSVTGGTTTQYGGALVATEKRGLADDFYNASVLRQNGALVLEGLVGNIDLPRYTKASNPTHKAENAAGDELSPTVGKLSLSPKRLCAYVDISDQLVAQSSVALEAFLRSAIGNQLADVQETAFFHGAGGTSPTGIAATSGIGSVAGGTNGAAPSWANIVALETAVSVVNAASGNLRYFTNSKVRGKLKGTAKIASTDSLTIWDDRNNGLLNGYTPVVTNAISSTLTKGTASGVCSAIFFGNASDFVIGYWGGLGLEVVRDKSGAIAGQYSLVASAYYDGGVLRAKSFAAMLDALTT